jgi:hypothetical protein
LLWWAGPVSFVLPLIAFFLSFFLPSSSAVIFLLLDSMVSPHLTSAVLSGGRGGGGHTLPRRLTNAWG